MAGKKSMVSLLIFVTGKKWGSGDYQTRFIEPVVWPQLAHFSQIDTSSAAHHLLARRPPDVSLTEFLLCDLLFSAGKKARSLNYVLIQLFMRVVEQKSRLRRYPLGWLSHWFSAFNVSAQKDLFKVQMASGRRAGCDLSRSLRDTFKTTTRLAPIK